MAKLQTIKILHKSKLTPKLRGFDSKGKQAVNAKKMVKIGQSKIITKSSLKNTSFGSLSYAVASF